MNYGMSKTAKHLRLAAPRGFCAGVDRAVKIVEAALDKFGSPVYVRHEIVHNKTVVNELADKGAIFVEELHEVPVGAPVVFSAHGVSRAVVDEAKDRKMIAVDATCPLVSKVHIETKRHAAQKRHIMLIGHIAANEEAGLGMRRAAYLKSRLEEKGIDETSPKPQRNTTAAFMQGR